MDMNLNTITKIALFGGSFDPIHIGHLNVADTILKQVKIDEIWFMPAFHPPHKNELTNFEDRFNMIQIAIKNNHKYKCIDIEKKLYDNKILEITSTYKVLVELQKIYSNSKFYLVIGYDSLLDLETWKDHEKLLSECSFIVANRNIKIEKTITNYIDNLKNQYDFKFIKVNNDNINISSSYVRQQIKNGNVEKVKKYLSLDVYNYIINQKIY